MEESPEDQKIKLLTFGAAFPLGEEKYNYLLKKDEWSVLEIIQIFGIKPENVRLVYGWMESSRNAGKLEPSRCEHLDNGRYKYFYDPLIITPWIIDKEIPGISDRVIEWYKNQGKPKPAEVPPYLDTKHQFHSPELAIAIEAWIAVLQDNPERPKVRSRKILIENWLKTHYPKLLPSEIERIAVMINPDKSH